MTDAISYGNTLKAFRRGVHVYGPDWSGIVIARSVQQSIEAAREAERIFAASSLHATFSATKHEFSFDPSGATLKFRAVAGIFGAHGLAGHTFSHIIWLYQPSDEVQRYVATLWRANGIDSDKLRMDYSDL
jgi:hypothetical protein